MKLEWTHPPGNNETILDLRDRGVLHGSQLMGWVSPLHGREIDIHYRADVGWAKLGPYASLDEAKAALIAVVCLEDSS